MISLTFVQTLLLAYVLYLTFEAPSVNLMKMLLKPKQHKSQQKTDSSGQQSTEKTDKKRQ